jgi:hypothetical protein
LVQWIKRVVPLGLQSARCKDLLGGEKLLAVLSGWWRSTRNHYLIQSGLRKIETDSPRPNLVKAYTVFP